MDDLKSMKLYQVKFAASIYQALNCALRNQMTIRFNSALSVIQLVRRDKDLASLYDDTRK